MKKLRNFFFFFSFGVLAQETLLVQRSGGKGHYRLGLKITLRVVQ